MTLKWEAGLHAAAGTRVENSAYERYVGRWSRLFLPAVLAAAKIGEGDRVLDVATGSGEAAQMAIGLVGSSGLVVGADISGAMLAAANARLSGQRFCAAAMDGQALAFRDASFDAVLCQLGLMFFPDPLRGLAEFRRVLRPGRRAAACVISTPDRAPMWGFLAEALSRRLPDHATTLQLSFALADPARLESMFQSAGFRDITVTEETREAIVESFDEYWGAIEAGPGSCLTYTAVDIRIRRTLSHERRDDHRRGARMIA